MEITMMFNEYITRIMTQGKMPAIEITKITLKSRCSN